MQNSKRKSFDRIGASRPVHQDRITRTPFGSFSTPLAMILDQKPSCQARPEKIRDISLHFQFETQALDRSKFTFQRPRNHLDEDKTNTEAVIPKLQQMA
jgi:hypothetical protein